MGNIVKKKVSIKMDIKEAIVFILNSQGALTASEILKIIRKTGVCDEKINIEKIIYLLDSNLLEQNGYVVKYFDYYNFVPEENIDNYINDIMI